MKLGKTDQDALKELSKISSIRFVWHVAFEWLIVFLLILIAERLESLLFTLLAIIVIGARQHAMFVLVHDASHYRAFNSKIVNDFIANRLLAFPLFFDVKSYRKLHLKHHKYTNTLDDPDFKKRMNPEWHFPKSRSDLFLYLVQDVTGFSLLREKSSGLLRSILNGGVKSLRGNFNFKALYVLLLCLVLVATNSVSLYILYWIVPLFTWTELLTRVRNISEHFCLEKDSFHPTRTIKSSCLSTVFMGIKNADYHYEHHLYPSVPFYNLPKLHSIIAKRKGYWTNVEYAPGYMSVLKRCCS